MDIIERENKLFVLDESGEKHEFDREGNTAIPKTDDTDVVSFVWSQEKYEAPEQETLPIEESYIVHLEDGPDYRFLVNYAAALEHAGVTELTYSGNYQLETNWLINESGTLNLQSIEYNGVKYTPE